MGERTNLRSGSEREGPDPQIPRIYISNRERLERVLAWIVTGLAVGFIAGHVVTMIALSIPVGQ